jgi:hypothetical protein
VTRRLGLLGPIIVAVGAGVAGLGAWYVLHVRPRPGAVIDTIAIEPNVSLVLRAEETSDHSFLELHVGDEVRWQAMIPHYAGAPGRPAVAWNRTAVTVRVERDGHAEVFAFAARDALKIGGYRLAQEHEPIRTQAEGPITLTDHVRAYELVGGDDWHQLIAVELQTGNGVWKVELGKLPIHDGGVQDGRVWIEQAGHRRSFDAATGAEDHGPAASN